MKILGKISYLTLYLLNLATISLGTLMVLGFFYMGKYQAIPEDSLLAQAPLVEKAFPSMTPTPTSTPTPTPTPIPKPVSIAIPKLNVETTVVAIGVIEGTSEMEVPESGELVGWYVGSATPGEKGSSVFTGHYDMPGGAPAVFYNLNQMQLGDEFFVINEQGKKFNYETIEVINESLDNFPKEKVFASKKMDQISLITCSGVWNYNLGIYSNRLAVIGKLKSVTEVDTLIADSSGAEVMVGEIEDMEIRNRASSYVGKYLRMEKSGEKAKIYLATNGAEVYGLRINIKVKGLDIEKVKRRVSLYPYFQVQNMNIERNKLIISVYSDPKRKEAKLLNTNKREYKIAEIDLKGFGDNIEIELGRDYQIFE